MDVTSVLIGKDFMCFIIANILLSKLPILFYSIYQKQKQFSAERVEVKRAFRRYCCDFFYSVLIWEVHRAQVHCVQLTGSLLDGSCLSHPCSLYLNRQIFHFLFFLPTFFPSQHFHSALHSDFIH